MAFTVICMGKNINLRDVELKLRFDNLHITIEQVLSLMKKSIRLKKAHYL